MFEFTRNFYEASGNGGEGGSDSPFTPGQIIISEQTVETTPPTEGAIPSAVLISDFAVAPTNLLINFNGTDYEITVDTDRDFYNYHCYSGESDEMLFTITLFPPQGWTIVTPNQGTYTISAKIPEEKSPKVLSFPKGRTIVSELSRLNKAFGTVSKKKTIIGQLSDIADAAEAGKIGGGSGLFIVNTKVNVAPGQQSVYENASKNASEIVNTKVNVAPGQQSVYENASKNASEIVNAASNNQLPVLFIHSEPNANDVAMPVLYFGPVYVNGLLKYAKFNAIGANQSFLVDVDNKIITLESNDGPA